MEYNIEELKNNTLILNLLKLPYATKGVMGSSDIYYNTTELLGYDSQYSISEFKFNTSWDWIMPVVEKLHYEGVEFTINDWGTLSNVKNILTYNFTLNKNRKGKHCYKTLLDATYQNVVNAIKLLNKFNTIELLNK